MKKNIDKASIRFVAVLTAFAWANLGATPLFDDDSVLDVTLSGPLGTTFANTEDRTERVFRMKAEGVEHEVKVRLRGRSRLRVCEFPPLRLNLRRADTDQTVFEGQDKLKLVTHCRNKDYAEQDMLEEYAAYRIFNALTDISYRVRLMRFSYEDTDGQLSPKGRHRFGFVLETAAQLAARTGTTPVTLRGVPKQRHDVDQAALVYVYQYLVANTDWGLVKADDADGCCHNVDLFERDNLVVTVPYDLDLSGLVNAKYAHPDHLLRIKKVTHRLYRGLCTERAVLSAAIDRVVSKEADVLQVLQEVPGLTVRNRESAVRFVNQFFEKARDKDKLISNFERRCL